MPIIRARYPEDWEAIELCIKHEANWCCQQCRRPCRKLNEPLTDRVKFDIEGLREQIDAAYAENPIWERLSLVQKLRMFVEERLTDIQQAKESKS